MRLLVLNGPSLNLLGRREPDVYGHETLADLENLIRAHCREKGVEVTFLQSNHEGALIDAIHGALGTQDAILINPAAYTHTSIALPDAIKAVGLPAVEVHISNVKSREAFRHHSYISAACLATIAGKGFQGYLEGIDLLLGHLTP